MSASVHRLPVRADRRQIPVDNEEARKLALCSAKLLAVGLLGDPLARELSEFVRRLEARYYAAKVVEP